MSTLTEELRASLLEMLLDREGEPITIGCMVKRTGVGSPALRAVLRDMEAQGVRCGGTARLAVYYIPTASMLEVERRIVDQSTKNPFRPLRRRADHEAALARARGSHLDLPKVA